MNCARFEQFVLRQEPLPPSGHEHQRRCARCQEFMHQLQTVDRELEAFLAPPSLPPGFDQKLAARLAPSALKSSDQVSLAQLMEEDAQKWERVSGRKRQELLRIGLDSLGAATLVTITVLNVCARLRDGLPNGPLAESIPFSPVQIAVLLGSAALCAASGIWSTLQFRRQA